MSLPAPRPTTLEDVKLEIRSLIDAEEIDQAWTALQGHEPAFAARDLVGERADLLRLDLKFEEEIDCLRSAWQSDPQDPPIARRLVDAWIQHGEPAQAKPIIDEWCERYPRALSWLRARLDWGWATYRDWPPLVTLIDEAFARASDDGRVELTFDRLRLLMRMSRHDEADRCIDEFRASLPQLSAPAARKRQLELRCARQLTFLGRHRDSRRILERLLPHAESSRVRDQIHQIACANESFGGGDYVRYEQLRACISEPRHQVWFTDFRDPPGKATPRLRTLVLLHLYHLDLWPELRAALASLQGTAFALNVTVPRELPAEIAREVREVDPQARIIVVENRGFDVGAHWQSLDGVDLGAFDVAVLLQTKKSRHTRIGEIWQRNLVQALLGTPARWRENLWAFAEDPGLGLIGAGLHQRSFDQWSYRRMREVLVALGMPTRFDALKEHHQFVAGTQVMIRADLLAKIHAATRGRIAFEPVETLSLRQQIGETSAHALEKAIGMYVHWRGCAMLWRPS